MDFELLVGEHVGHVVVRPGSVKGPVWPFSTCNDIICKHAVIVW